MKELKPGDRVRVYVSTAEPFIGEILERPLSEGSYRDCEYVRYCDTQGCAWFHRKQLRKLVKKERRRVWGRFWPDGRFEAFTGPTMPSDATEFVEVRPKK